MAFNGSGTYVRLYNWVNDKAANIKARADRMDAEMDGMATGLSTCITKDGQTTVTANLPMANFKHTGVANGSARTDYAALGQTQDSKLNWVVAGGTVDAITATYSPAITALVDGQECCVRTSGTNVSTTPTFAPNGLTARTIVKDGGGALLVGDIPAEAILRYTLASTRWELLNPKGFVRNAGNETIAGNKTFSGTTALQAPLDASNASAGQIIFPATQNSSTNVNTLDDYEEGTWTPVLTFATPGNLSVSYSSQVGTYIKIGGMVTVSFAIQTSAFTHSTASGACLITGLPFTAVSGSNRFWTGALISGGITKASYSDFDLQLTNNTTQLEIIASGTGVAAGNVNAADMPTAGTVLLRGTLTYFSHLGS